MSRRLIFLALLSLSICWTSTCEAQLFRRGAVRRANQATYNQRLYAQQAAQRYAQQYAQQASKAKKSNEDRDADDAQQTTTLYKLPNGRYAVLREGRYYYAQPKEIAAYEQAQQTRRNAYAEQTYGRQANQAARINSTVDRTNPVVQVPTVAAPTPIRTNLPTPVAADRPRANDTLGTGGKTVIAGAAIEGPAIVGPVVAEEKVPTDVSGNRSVVLKTTGTLPVGTIHSAVEIPATVGGPIDGPDETQESFSILEKIGNDK